MCEKNDGKRDVYHHHELDRSLIIEEHHSFIYDDNKYIILNILF